MKNSKKIISRLKSYLNPRNYKWGILGMIIFFVGSVVAWLLQNVEVLPKPDVVDFFNNPMYANFPGNIYNDDSV